MKSGGVVTPSQDKSFEQLETDIFRVGCVETSGCQFLFVCCPHTHKHTNPSPLRRTFCLIHSLCSPGPLTRCARPSHDPTLLPPGSLGFSMKRFQEDGWELKKVNRNSIFESDTIQNTNVQPHGAMWAQIKAVWNNSTIESQQSGSYDWQRTLWDFHPVGQTLLENTPVRACWLLTKTILKETCCLSPCWADVS